LIKKSSVTTKFENKLEFDTWFKQNQASIPCYCFYEINDNQSLYKRGKKDIIRNERFYR
jgi:hypothetical protein